MFNLGIFITLLIGITFGLPTQHVSSRNGKGSFDYKLGKFVNDPVPTRTIPESAHVRVAPQDPTTTGHEQIEQYRRPAEISGRNDITPDQYYNLEREQAESAHYAFDSSIQDNIFDNSNVRSETRDGLKVTGMYAYSDGFFHRTIDYIADENGYRVIKETAKPIGNGPQYNPAGRADVSSSLAGSYSITIDDFRSRFNEDQDLTTIRP